MFRRHFESPVGGPAKVERVKDNFFQPFHTLAWSTMGGQKENLDADKHGFGSKT